MRSAAAPFADTRLQARRELAPAVVAVLLLAIIAAGAVLRFLYLDRKSFWLDEGVSVTIARLDWGNLLHILWRREANMAFYYGLLRIWLHLGSSEYFVRSLSALISVAAIPVIYLLGKRLFGTTAGLFAAALFSVHAWQVRYAQEARSYSLFVLLTLLASLFFLRAIEQSSRRNWAAYIACATLAIYSHFFSVLVIVAHWVAFQSFPADEETVRAFRRSLKILGLLFLPLAVFIASRGMGPLSWISRPGWADLHHFALDLTGNGGDVLLALYAACGVLALRACKMGREVSSESWPCLFLLSWLLVPFAITLGFSWIRPVFLPRYLLTCVAPLVLLAAAGIANLRIRSVGAAALACVLFLSMRGTASYYRADFDLSREDWRAATQYLLGAAKPGDGVIFHSAQARMPFEYYAGASPARRDLRIIFPAYGDTLTYLDFLANARNVPLAAIPGNYRRVWLVLAHNQLKGGEPDPTTNTIEDFLGRNYRLATTANFAGNLQLRLYTTPE